MNIAPFTSDDIQLLPGINPPDWSDIREKFEYYCSHDFCFPYKLLDGDKLIGSGVYILHNDVAWLAHIIVHPEYRNQGLGNKMTVHLIEMLKNTSCSTIYLIATDLGAAVYSKIGFITETDYLVYQKPENLIVEYDYSNCFPFSEKYKEQIKQLDILVSGENRFFRLEEYLKSAIIYKKNNGVEGCYLPDFGEGLIIAKSPEAGITLMHLRLQNHDNAILPLENTTAVQLLNKLEFTLLKKIKRMRLGPERSWKPEFLYNRNGGNTG